APTGRLASHATHDSLHLRRTETACRPAFTTERRGEVDGGDLTDRMSESRFRDGIERARTLTSAKHRCQDFGENDLFRAPRDQAEVVWTTACPAVVPIHGNHAALACRLSHVLHVVAAISLRTRAVGRAVFADDNRQPLLDVSGAKFVELR